MRDSVPSARYSSVYNVLRQWRIWLIPTYRVYRLYDIYFNQNHVEEGVGGRVRRERGRREGGSEERE